MWFDAPDQELLISLPQALLPQFRLCLGEPQALGTVVRDPLPAAFLEQLGKIVQVRLLGLQNLRGGRSTNRRVRSQRRQRLQRAVQGVRRRSLARRLV